MMSYIGGPDWDRRYSKHYVRRDAWLPASIEYMKRTGKKVIKYFTLCDTKAIDIFMLEKEGILLRDYNGKLPNVVICEGDRRRLEDIIEIVKPPLEEAIILASLEDLLTFEDDERTRATPVRAYVKDPKLRRRLLMKEKHERLKLMFPFDIINFDPCNSLLEEALSVNRLYKALERIFEFQKLTNQFLLFITTGISDIHGSIARTFIKDFDENIKNHTELKEEIIKSLGEAECNKIPEPYKTAICFVKSIVIKIAKNSGWYCVNNKAVVYENPDGKRMLGLVTFCRLSGEKQEEIVYIGDIISMIRRKVGYHSYEGSLKDESIKEHLKEIVEYREMVRKS